MSHFFAALCDSITCPLYVSPGHRITLPECLEITLGCVTRYRLPLPVRQADLLSRRLRA